MSTQVGDEITIMSSELRQPVRQGQIRGVADDSDGVVYLVRWSDTGHESLLRPGPDMVIKHQHRHRVPSLPPRLRHPLEWRPSRGRERRQQVWDELVWDEWDGHLARRVEDILAGLGLSHFSYSIGGGRTILVPEVVSMGPGPVRELDIEILPGQSPQDVSAHHRTIADELDVADVKVVSLGPDQIRLVLVPHDPQPGHPPTSR